MGGCGTGGGCGVGNSYNPGQYVGIRINEHEDGRSVLCDTMGIEVSEGQRVVVEGDQGLEYAEVTNLRPMILKQCQLRDSKRLVRVATDADLHDLRGQGGPGKAVPRRHAHAGLREAAPDEADPGRGELRRPKGHGLLHFRDRGSTTASSSRTSRWHHPVRIEMRQIGPRDETKMRGGIGPCGLTLCCSTFLKSFHPVTIKMAKNQNLSLNPSKISGMCGRLMCCLAYEDEGPRPGLRAVRRRPRIFRPTCRFRLSRRPNLYRDKERQPWPIATLPAAPSVPTTRRPPTAN